MKKVYKYATGHIVPERAFYLTTIVEEVYQAVFDDPNFAKEVLNYMLSGLHDYRKVFVKKNSCIDLIVRNIKPEYIEEMRKVIIDDVFEVVGIKLKKES